MQSDQKVTRLLCVNAASARDDQFEAMCFLGDKIVSSFINIE
jgi:hypothetical protein